MSVDSIKTLPSGSGKGWNSVKERDTQKDCKKCIHIPMFQSCLWTVRSRGPFYSGEKLVVVHEYSFKQQHCHTWLIHFRQSQHPISTPKGLMSCHTAPEYLISAAVSCMLLCSTLSYLCVLRVAWMYSILQGSRNRSARTAKWCWPLVLGVPGSQNFFNVERDLRKPYWIV